MLSPEIYALLFKALLDTLHMVAVSGILGTLLGLPIGVMLAVATGFWLQLAMALISARWTVMAWVSA